MIGKIMPLKKSIVKALPLITVVAIKQKYPSYQELLD
jgi:hypothetical protein